MIDFLDVLKVFGMSMLPVFELRGSIVVGAAMDLPWWLNYIVSVCGNLLPVPFILLFIRGILHWMKGVKGLCKIALWLEKKAQKHSVKVMKYATFGLFLFVAIPIPGTGAWTGALVASLFDMRMKYSLVSIACGVLCAGVVMICASYGFISFLSIFA